MDQEIKSAEAASWLQPYEGVAGVDQNDGLLDLDDSALGRRRTLMDEIQKVWQRTLRAHHASQDGLRFQRMGKPVAGDYVLEVTSLFRQGDEAAYNFGILLDKRKEWASSDEEWAALMVEEKAASEEAGYPFEGRERLPDTAWYVQYGPKVADVCRWRNCMFIAAPPSVIQRAKDGRL